MNADCALIVSPRQGNAANRAFASHAVRSTGPQKLLRPNVRFTRQKRAFAGADGTYAKCRQPLWSCLGEVRRDYAVFPIDEAFDKRLPLGCPLCAKSKHSCPIRSPRYRQDHLAIILVGGSTLGITPPRRRAPPDAGRENAAAP
jgi:hypothetical protein